MTSLRRVATLVAAAAMLVGLAACSKSGHAADASTAPAGCSAGLNDHVDLSYCGFGLDPAQPRPQFSLIDSAGKPVFFQTLTGGQPTLLFFGYTTCPDVCPTTMADIANALRGLPAAKAAKVKVVFVSTDPATDTTPVIQAWLAKFAPPTPFIGLRGTDAQVHVAEAAAHVTLSQDEGQTHSAEVLLYGADDYAHVAFEQSDDETADMTHDLLKVVA